MQTPNNDTIEPSWMIEGVMYIYTVFSRSPKQT